MKVLLIGSDRNLFEEREPVRARHRAYAKELGALDCIVTNTARAETIADGALHIHPTNSFTRLFYGIDVLRVALTLAKPDVVTVQDPFELGLIGWVIARLRNVPLHVQVHTDFTAPGFAHSFHQKMRVRLAWFTLRRAMRARVVSEKIRNALVARGVTAPITVLPIFTDTTRLNAIVRIKHPRYKIALLCVGRFEPEKRFELAIRALAAARERGHDAGLTLVGTGSGAYDLKQLVRELKLERFVTFAGWQSDIAPYLAEADVVLVPSTFEGYGMVIVEALAAGVPVLSTDVGVAREAGAIIADAARFSEKLIEWIERGPRQAALMLRVYANVTEYVRAWCDDVRATKT